MFLKIERYDMFYKNFVKTKISYYLFLFLLISCLPVSLIFAEQNNASSSFELLKLKKLREERIISSISMERYKIDIENIEIDDRVSFKAEYVLVNRSNSAIEFELISLCGEDKPVQFILRDSEENILWQYIFIGPLAACPALLEEFTLMEGDALRHGIDVPLKIDERFLESGDYCLEAFIDGNPKFGAFAPFKIE